MGCCSSSTLAPETTTGTKTRPRSTSAAVVSKKKETKVKYTKLDSATTTKWDRIRTEEIVDYHEPPGADDKFCIKLCALTYFSKDYFIDIIEKYIDEPPKEFSKHLKCARKLVQKDNSTARICFPKVASSDKNKERFMVWPESKNDCHVYVVLDVTTRRLYISVRPTGSIKNWLSNFEVKLKPNSVEKEDLIKLTLSENKTDVEVENLMLHSGFMNKYLGVHETVTAILISIMDTVSEDNKLDRIVWTGMSMGAAVVSILACKIVNDHGPMLKSKCKAMEMVLFGSPRAGNGKFADFVSNLLPVRNVFNKHDIVHRIPTNLQGYWHIHPCMQWDDPDESSFRKAIGVPDAIAHNNYLGMDFLFWPE